MKRQSNLESHHPSTGWVPPWAPVSNIWGLPAWVINDAALRALKEDVGCGDLTTEASGCGGIECSGCDL